MIVSRRDGRLVLVRQVDHQEQCGRMAERWGNALFVRPEPYGPVREAAFCHDEGWRAWERAPEVDGEGRPIDFPKLARSRHVALYRQSIAHALARGPGCGLLVSMHGQGLYEARRGLDGTPEPRSERTAAVRGFLDEQDGVQRRARAALLAAGAAEGAGEAEGDGLDAWTWAGYRLLQAWDVLSLYLLWWLLPAGREWSLPQVPRAPGDAGVSVRLWPDREGGAFVDPWPFDADALDLPTPARAIPDRAYADHADLRAALARVEPTVLACRLRPGG